MEVLDLKNMYFKIKIQKRVSERLGNKNRIIETKVR